MHVGLFIPCYIEQFYPEVAIATLQILEKAGCQVDYPLNQTCCGQPMANSGYENDALSCMNLFVENFAGYDYIVAPSGSCVLFVKEHYERPGQDKNAEKIRSTIYELCEFLTDIVQVKSLQSKFPYKVGLHESSMDKEDCVCLNLQNLTCLIILKSNHCLPWLKGINWLIWKEKMNVAVLGEPFA